MIIIIVIVVVVVVVYLKWIGWWTQHSTTHTLTHTHNTGRYPMCYWRRRASLRWVSFGWLRFGRCRRVPAGATAAVAAAAAAEAEEAVAAAGTAVVVAAAVAGAIRDVTLYFPRPQLIELHGIAARFHRQHTDDHRQMANR